MIVVRPEYEKLWVKLTGPENPNVLTLDKGTPRLAPGPIVHTCLIEEEKIEGEVPEVTAFEPLEIIDAST